MPRTARERSAGLAHTSTSAASGIETQRNGTQGREKAKSSNSYGQLQYNEGRRGSLRPSINTNGNQSLRPGVLARTSSAPLLDSGRPIAYLGSRAAERSREDLESDETDEQEDVEASGLSNAILSFRPFHTPEARNNPAEINIAVIGADEVDKSSFISKALGLPHVPRSQAATLEIPYRRRYYLVRLLEVAIDDTHVSQDHDDADENDDKSDGELDFKALIDHKAAPKIDGALALYDVRDGNSVEHLDEMLGAISKEVFPTFVVSCKCETPETEREVDPARVEDGLRDAYPGIGSLRISDADPSSYKRTITKMLDSIIATSPEDVARISTSRPRASSSAVRAVSPRAPGNPNHSRASSEYTGSLYKEQRYGKQDSTNSGYTPSSHLRVPREHSQEHMHSSFLLEESGSDASVESPRSSMGVDEGGASGLLTENGVLFDDLVDRLLAQPASKGDVKYAAIFLALYRKFAAPGRLLEAIVHRFDVLERKGGADMLKTVHQLRYVAILEQWIATYPGDFAFSRTKQRLLVFVTKLSEARMFAVAAKEISADLEAVHEDDDTAWAYSDKSQEESTGPDWRSVSSSASTLINDPSYIFAQELDYSAIHRHFAAAETVPQPVIVNHKLLNVEAAQKQAALLQPIPRYPITKIHWRQLMELSDEVIAKELTRVDWIMFSAIRPRDLVRHVSFTKEQKYECRNLIHVNHMIDHFNTLANWVVNYILLRDKSKHRAMMLEKFMRVARKLREMNNYNSLGAIIAGVKSTAIHRLNATRELISPAIGRDWLKLEILMAPSRSHSAYRLAWENSSSERIPYIPLHRRDLITAEEGNKTFIGDEREGRINWKKFEIMGDVIVSLQRAQDTGYKSLGGFKGNEQVRELVLDVKLNKDEEDLYDRSLQCEPVASTDRGGSISLMTSSSAKFRDFFKRNVMLNGDS